VYLDLWGEDAGRWEGPEKELNGLLLPLVVPAVIISVINGVLCVFVVLGGPDLIYPGTTVTHLGNFIFSIPFKPDWRLG
jgi:ABC-type spermidine/putrescine transport system permease subunit II